MECNQCKVAFESGPQLLEHLDEIRRAEHKVIEIYSTFLAGYLVYHNLAISFMRVYNLTFLANIL